MDVKTIVKTMGGAATLARKLGMPDGDVGAKAVRAWVNRDSIPAVWFTAIASAARSEGHGEITVETLAGLAERRRLRFSANEAAAA